MLKPKPIYTQQRLHKLHTIIPESLILIPRLRVLRSEAKATEARISAPTSNIS
ncbi:hypothetical protein KSS87_017329 [Heliosperma pusillum]|nr:hypothetical protein KSS87_017329 [Heliosperma pusillum]